MESGFFHPLTGSTVKAPDSNVVDVTLYFLQRSFFICTQPLNYLLQMVSIEQTLGDMCHLLKYSMGDTIAVRTPFTFPF